MASSRIQYVKTVVDLYAQLPETPQRPRPQDYQLAYQLYDRRIPLSVVESSLLLASARRLLRNPQAPRLSPIRSLYYFLPVIEELLQNTISADYVRYLRIKLRLTNLLPAPVQKSAVSRDR